MFAGQLDKRLTWQRATQSKDAKGGVVETWSTLFETWCCRLEDRGRESVVSAETQDTQRVTLQLRWRPDFELKTTDRFQHAGRTWRIVSLAELGRQVGHQVSGLARTDTDQVA